MHQTTINSITDFLDFVNLSEKPLYRGESMLYSTALVPKVARSSVISNSQGVLEKLESDCLKLFKTHGSSHLQGISDIWQLMAVGQHHGLPTRLLDWTFNPMVALYFAVKDSSDKDGFVYRTTLSETVDPSTVNDPTSLKNFCVFHPPRSISRMIAQDPAFIVHPSPVETAMKIVDHIVIVPAKIKKDIKIQIDTIGFSEATLFPDLDGLARWISEIKCY